MTKMNGTSPSGFLPEDAILPEEVFLPVLPEEVLSLSRASERFNIPATTLRNCIDFFPDIFQKTLKGGKAWEIPLHEMEKIKEMIGRMDNWFVFSEKLDAVGLNYHEVKLECYLKNIKMPRYLRINDEMLYAPEHIDTFIDSIKEKNMFPKKTDENEDIDEKQTGNTEDKKQLFDDAFPSGFVPEDDSAVRLTLRRAAEMLDIPMYLLRESIEDFPYIFPETQKKESLWEIPLNEIKKFKEMIDGLDSKKLQAVGMDYYKVKHKCYVNDIKSDLSPEETHETCDLEQLLNVECCESDGIEDYEDLEDIDADDLDFDDADNEVVKEKSEKKAKSRESHKKKISEYFMKPFMEALAILSAFSAVIFASFLVVMIGYIGYTAVSSHASETGYQAAATKPEDQTSLPPASLLPSPERGFLVDIDRYVLTDLYRKTQNPKDREEIKKLYWQVKEAMLRLGEYK